MIAKLLVGLTEEESDEFRGEFKAAVRFRKRMVAVLRKEMDEKHTKMRDDSNFDSPSWSLIQAEKIGQLKALKQIIDYFEEK